MVNGTKIKYDGNLVLYNQKIMQQVTVTKYESHDFRGNVHTLLLDKVLDRRPQHFGGILILSHHFYYHINKSVQC